MKRSIYCLLALLALGVAAQGAALGTAANAVIPAEVQQIISVDYRRLANSPTALALKARVLPDNLKQFEAALKSAGVDPDKDMDQLTFASFRTPGQGLRFLGIAQGQFARAKVLRRMRVQKIRPVKYRSSFLYPMGNGMQMTFLDDWTLLFGDDTAVKTALDTRDGEGQSLNANSQVTDMIQSVSSVSMWSVLDALGTQNLMRSTLGDAAKLADYEVVRKRLLGSLYTMDFSSGVDFDLSVLTSDSFTAATLSSLVRAGVLFRKMTASGVEKTALESVTVDSESDRLKVHFKSDDQKFQSLLHSDLFAAIAH